MPKAARSGLRFSPREFFAARPGTRFQPPRVPASRASGIESLTIYRSMYRSEGHVVRLLVVTFFALSAIFWLLFAFSEFPLIVPADHNATLVKDAEQSSAAGGGLFVLSLICIWIPTGSFGRRRVLVAVTLATSAGWLAVTPFLYPELAVVRFPCRLSAHLLGFFALLVGVATTYQPRSAV